VSAEWSGDEANENDSLPPGTGVAGTHLGGGVISGTVHPCQTQTPPTNDTPPTVTGAPDAEYVPGGENGLEFQLGSTAVAKDDLVTGVEYRLGDGDWFPVTTRNEDEFQHSGTITGRKTGKQYSVTFRFTTAEGHADASAALVGSPVLPGPSQVTTEVVAAPVIAATLPKASGTLTSDTKDGEAVAGQRSPSPARTSCRVPRSSWSPTRLRSSWARSWCWPTAPSPLR